MRYIHMCQDTFEQVHMFWRAPFWVFRVRWREWALEGLDGIVDTHVLSKFATFVRFRSRPIC